jgi:hypothetical protein
MLAIGNLVLTVLWAPSDHGLGRPAKMAEIRVDIVDIFLLALS